VQKDNEMDDSKKDFTKTNLKTVPNAVLAPAPSSAKIKSNDETMQNNNEDSFSPSCSVPPIRFGHGTSLFQTRRQQLQQQKQKQKESVFPTNENSASSLIKTNGIHNDNKKEDNNHANNTRRNMITAADDDDDDDDEKEEWIDVDLSQHRFHYNNYSNSGDAYTTETTNTNTNTILYDGWEWTRPKEKEKRLAIRHDAPIRSLQSKIEHLGLSSSSEQDRRNIHTDSESCEENTACILPLLQNNGLALYTRRKAHKQCKPHLFVRVAEQNNETEDDKT